MDINQKSSADHIIEHLNAIEIDGETMEYIINGVNMNYQMLRQLIMKSNDLDIYNIMSERNEIHDQMIEFAKLHVEAALKAASEESTINKNKGQITAREFLNVLDGSYSINKQSILNSYPLDNIK